MIEIINGIPEYGGFREVEFYFGVPPETSRQLIARKLVRAAKISHRIIVEFDSMRAYLGSLPVVTVDELPCDTRPQTTA